MNKDSDKRSELGPCPTCKYRVFRGGECLGDVQPDVRDLLASLEPQAGIVEALREALVEARRALRPFAIKPSADGWYAVPCANNHGPAVEALAKIEAVLATLE